ncbi:hypothetical protein B296_00041787, partial [Ensete ventricosum]
VSGEDSDGHHRDIANEPKAMFFEWETQVFSMIPTILFANVVDSASSYIRITPLQQIVRLGKQM